MASLNKTVHRDVKPSNLLVNDEGDDRVIDFTVEVRFGASLENL